MYSVKIYAFYLNFYKIFTWIKLKQEVGDDLGFCVQYLQIVWENVKVIPLYYFEGKMKKSIRKFFQLLLFSTLLVNNLK